MVIPGAPALQRALPFALLLLPAALLLLSAALLLGGCSICCTIEDCCPSPCCAAEGGSGRIGIEIPPAVHAGVLKALPGFVATEFEIESKNGARLYEFEGTSEGGHYEIQVDEQGNVLQIDQETAQEIDD